MWQNECEKGARTDEERQNKLKMQQLLEGVVLPHQLGTKSSIVMSMRALESVEISLLS